MSAPYAVDRDFIALVEQVFADHASGLLADAPLDATDPEFGRQLDALGLARLATPEADGGSGATWHEAAVVLRTAARHGIPVPAVEHDLLSGGGAGPGAGAGEARRLRGALLRAIQLTGAMDVAVELALRHTRERVQFGRPLAAFQAVQQLVADAAAEAALARTATDAALALAVTSGFTDAGLPVAVAVARSVAGRAGSVVVRNVHQAHGAIGTTLEHPLHRVTMPILFWTNDFGTVAEWEDLLVTAARGAGGAGLWGLVSGTADR